MDTNLLNQQFVDLQAQITGFISNVVTEKPQWATGEKLIKFPRTNDSSDNFTEALLSLEYGQGLQINTPDGQYPKGLLFSLVRKGELFYRRWPNYINLRASSSPITEWSEKEQLESMAGIIRSNQPNLMGYVLKYDCTIPDKYIISFDLTRNYLKEGKNQPFSLITSAQRWDCNFTVTKPGAHVIEQVQATDPGVCYMLGQPYIWECYTTEGTDDVCGEQVFTDHELSFSAQKNNKMEKIYPLQSITPIFNHDFKVRVF